MAALIGVVADVVCRGLDEVSLDLYDPSTQSTLSATDLVVPPAATGWPWPGWSASRRDPGPRGNCRRRGPLEAIVGRASAPWLFGAWVFTLFALVATALTALGLFSVVALDVASAAASSQYSSPSAHPGGPSPAACSRPRSSASAWASHSAWSRPRPPRPPFADFSTAFRPSTRPTYAGVIAVIAAM